MTFPFNPARGLIVVRAVLWGPAGRFGLRLALDTGATTTVVSRSALWEAGYDPTASTERSRVATGSGVETAPRISIHRIDALGQTRHSFPVLAHTMPLSGRVSGVLGLDFMRGYRLIIDFRAGCLTLE